MDCVMGIPRTLHQNDLIWVIVDRMTKSAHFFPVRITFLAEDYAKLYLQEIVKLHGVPILIIFYHGTRFKSHFGSLSRKDLGLRLVLVLLFTHSRTGKQRELFRHWKICFELV